MYVGTDTYIYGHIHRGTDRVIESVERPVPLWETVESESRGFKHWSSENCRFLPWHSAFLGSSKYSTDSVSG